jgi:hypothetical protein
MFARLAISACLAAALLAPATGWASAQEALEKVKAGEHLTARRLAEEVFAGEPTDGQAFLAHYVLAQVYWDADGNLPRAAHHFDEADSLYWWNKSDIDAELGEDGWRTHWSVLRGKAFVAESMERTTLYLKTVDDYNEKYDPDLKAETGWALMKAGRVDEARAVAEEGLASEDSWQVSLGYNVLCALEAKLVNRQAAHDACMESLEFDKASGTGILVAAYNASTTAIAVFDFEACEELLLLSAGAGSGTTTNPWRSLASLYLQEGRGAEAVDAVRRMQAWRQGQKPKDRAQSRAGADATLATVLLVAGNGDQAREAIDRALKFPDRRATTSTSHAATKGSHLLIRHAIRRLQREQVAEEATMAGVFGRIGHWLGSWVPDVGAWEDDVEIAGILQDGELLTRTLGPYEDDGMSPAIWLVGDLVHILGPGVLQEAIDRGRTRDDFPGVQAYYDAYEAEVAWARGQSRTVALAESALEGLPEAEVLLRARVAALAADHLWNASDPRAYGMYERAMQLDPSVLRRLALPLPARVSDSGSEVDAAAAAMIGRSPRIAWDANGFVVDVSGRRACLATPTGSRLGCHRPDDDAGAVDERARAVVEAFHAGAFALPLGLSLVDMRSLDGTTRLDAEARREALQNVLEAL